MYLKIHLKIVFCVFFSVVPQLGPVPWVLDSSSEDRSVRARLGSGPLAQSGRSFT